MIGSMTTKQQGGYEKELAFLAAAPETQTLSRACFLERLESMHFICMFYDESYEFTASAGLLDCVEWAKPIVGSRRTLFEDLESAFGEIGYLCDESQRTQVVESILENLDVARYQRQVAGMLAVKASRSPQLLALRQSELVEELLRG